jgi:hypothetical protein
VDEEVKAIAKNGLYAIYAESEDQSKPLLQLDITFARLIDDIVVPYQSNETFFIDGVPVNAKNLKRIKILKLKETYSSAKAQFEYSLTVHVDHQIRKTYGEQYSIRFENVLRNHSEDVTSQVIKAYDQAIRPSLKDYIPKREELISAATKIFMESIKALSS